MSAKDAPPPETVEEEQQEFVPEVQFRDFFKNAQFIQGAFDRGVISPNEYRLNLARCGLWLFDEQAPLPPPPVAGEFDETEVVE